MNVLKALGDAIVRGLGKLFAAEVNISENLNNIVARFEQLKDNYTKELSTLRDFKFNPAWNSRVIHVPTAIDRIREMIDTVSGFWMERFDLIKDPIHQLKLIFGSEKGDVGDPNQPSGVTKAAVKIDELATMIAQISHAMDKVADLSDFFVKITKEIQGLEFLFLSQSNPQKKIDKVIRQRQRLGNG